MSDFSRVSNFDPTANYKFVRVGADCPVLEIELNEMQQISEQRLQNLTKTFVGEGVKGSGSYSYEHGVLTITNEEAIVDGVPLKITTLKLNMSEGEKAYIQMWIKEVTYNDTLKYMGNVQESRTVTNKILDTNIGRETSRRMQIQYDLVKDTSQRSDLNPVNLYVGKIEGGKFILDSSLLKTFTNTKNVEKFEVTQDTTQFNTKGAYRVNSNSLQIFVDGVIQLMGYDEDYVEVNSNTFRFNSPVKKGSEVIAIYSNAVVSEERPNTHGSTHNASGDDPIDISDLADRFGVRDKLTKSSDVLKQLGHAIERGEPVAQTIEQGTNKIETENARMEANIQTAQGVQRELKASCDLAPTKKAELDTSIQEAKHFIENLDGSQNLPQMREEITTLQNGLKSNQDLAYEGHDLKCENTLDGRIEDIVLEGMTYQNLTKNISIQATGAVFENEVVVIDNSTPRDGGIMLETETIKPNSKYSLIYEILENKNYQGTLKLDNFSSVYPPVEQLNLPTKVGRNIIVFITKPSFEMQVVKIATSNTQNIPNSILKISKNIMILEGDYTQLNSYIPPYFEGIKSVAETEKNLCEFTELGGIKWAEGEDYVSPNYCRSSYIPVKKGFKYSYSPIKTISNINEDVAIYHYDKNKVYKQEFNTTTTNGWFIAKLTGFVRIENNVKDGQPIKLEELAKVKRQVNEGELLPYIPPNKNKISILSKNKNLFDGFFNIENNRVKTLVLEKEGRVFLDSLCFSELSVRGYFENTGSYKKIEIYNTDDIKKPKNEWVVHSVKSYENNVECLFTINNPKLRYWVINVAVSYGSTVKVKDLQISAGKIQNNYEPYREDKKEILLPFSDGLKGLPNGAKDLIYNKEDGCYVRQSIGKYIVNGNEAEWRLSNGGRENKTKVTTFEGFKPTNLKPVSLDNTKSLISNMNINTFNNQFTNKEGIEGITIHEDAGLVISINKAKLETQDVEGFKKWLQANPVTVYYELAEPVETKLSDTKISLDTYNLLTYVFTDNTISPNIKAKVASNIGSIVQQNAKSINDLYKLLEDIIIPQVTQNAYDIALLSAK